MIIDISTLGREILITRMCFGHRASFADVEVVAALVVVCVSSVEVVFAVAVVAVVVVALWV